MLCELMLRGPQTLGELRTRAERMHRFDDLSEVETVLESMPELVMKLPRRPGEKEARYTHLLSGPPAVTEEETVERGDAPEPVRTDRIAIIEKEVTQIRDELEALKQQFARFRQQFE